MNSENKRKMESIRYITWNIYCRPICKIFTSKIVDRLQLNYCALLKGKLLIKNIRFDVKIGLVNLR